MNADPVKKVVLAVHGIGDQVRNATILSTAIRFCEHYAYPGMVPLGRFHGALEKGAPAVVLPSPPQRDGLTGEIGFAEVYWADVARDVAEKPYTLQETKVWVRSIVNRVRVMAGDEKFAGRGIDYQRIRLVLEEMVQTIRVIDSLLFLAKKAGLFEFNLRQVLDNFLGDVQLVTEFSPLREEVVQRFHRALGGVAAAHPNVDEIYIVAHSEGTVVAFLALLEAATEPDKYPWITRVRGFMTLGSPIDKHLILWPDLFSPFTKPGVFPKNAPPSIRWVNYVDNGDPVGFELDTAREWLARRGYDQVFKFAATDDIDFTRYHLPGKAHVDYWNDGAVFNHFIRTVVAPDANDAAPKPEAPKNKLSAQIVSWVAGYFLAIGVAALAVYVLYKGVSSYLSDATLPAGSGFVRTVCGLTALLIATTVWPRIAQLALARKWVWFGGGYYLAFAGLAWVLLRGQPIEGPTEWFELLPRAVGIPPGWGLFAGSLALVAAIFGAHSELVRQLLRDREAETFVVEKTRVKGDARHAAPAPRDFNTLRLMIWLGGAALAVTAIIFEKALPDGHDGPLWRLVLAGGAFLYLWWLATLVFDLVFIWHRYIRGAGATDFLRKTVWRANKATGRAGT